MLNLILTLTHLCLTNQVCGNGVKVTMPIGVLKMRYKIVTNCVFCSIIYYFLLPKNVSFMLPTHKSRWRYNYQSKRQK